MTDTTDIETPDEKTGAVKEFIEIVKTVAYALGIALVLRVLLFQPFTIPSASMEPNLYQGDYIIVSKFSYGWSKHSIPFSPPLFHGRILGHAPKRGDIIVFKLPRDPKVDYIKRLIGLPGDKVQVRGGVVYINGKVLDRKELPSALVDTGYGTIRAGRFQETNPEGRKYATQDYGPDSEADNTGVYTVPAGCYFFMGDNRDNSLDSRFDPGVSAFKTGPGTCKWDYANDQYIGMQEGVGFVPAENLVGRAQLILLSWNADAHLFKPWTWFLDARPSRFFRVLK
ncbi:S26 family signal peptidase [Caulobacter sp. Root1455]|uniref:signal peptidase I n=1 Tax=unclassified Caulobacter TaxID=2648921 RepID=UPI0006F79E23|nr:MULTISPECIES: signal peptidase I [unclassified Caulobacter]KQY34695.1 S26 family signal peptidase [Caulobacter sp. Root487D2Y]KQZ03591.1 S26 family signal peptidase [Caulobacter sp. Root1455]